MTRNRILFVDNEDLLREALYELLAEMWIGEGPNGNG